LLTDKEKVMRDYSQLMSERERDSDHFEAVMRGKD
jgi:hypothetical protein